MKTIWKRTPAWIKAILLLIITFLPVTVAIQTPIQLNLMYGQNWAWGALIAIPVWILYWYLIKKWDPFTKDEDVKLEWKFKLNNKKAWYRMLSMICLTYAVLQIFVFAFNVESTASIDMIMQFKILKPMVAIPLFLVLAINAGFLEEIVYRAFVQNTLHRAYGIWVSLIGVGLVFALSHFLPLSLVLPYMLVSMGFSVIAYELKSTAAGIWAHIIFDFLMFLNLYYDVIPRASTQALYLSLVSLVIGLFLLLKDNQLLSLKNHKNKELYSTEAS